MAERIRLESMSSEGMNSRFRGSFGSRLNPAAKWGAGASVESPNFLLQFVDTAITDNVPDLPSTMFVE